MIHASAKLRLFSVRLEECGLRWKPKFSFSLMSMKSMIPVCPVPPVQMQVSEPLCFLDTPSSIFVLPRTQCGTILSCGRVVLASMGGTAVRDPHDPHLSLPSRTGRLLANVLLTALLSSTMTSLYLFTVLCRSLPASGPPHDSHDAPADSKSTGSGSSGADLLKPAQPLPQLNVDSRQCS